MQVSTEAITSIKISITLSRDEAATLRDMMQNPLHDSENETEEVVRRVLFEALYDAA